MRALLLLTFIFLLTACRKTRPEFDGINCSGSCYILTGKVVDTPSNSAIQGVELKFYYRMPGYFIMGNPNKYLGKTTTNSNGEYTFQFDGSKYKSGEGYYRLQAFKRDFFFLPEAQNDVAIFSLDSTQFNIPFQQDIVLFRPAKLTVRFRATTVTNFIFLTFYYKYGLSETGFVINGGRKIDTTINFQTAGDVRTFVRWDAAGNGVNIHKADTLFTNQDGTIQYEVSL